MKVLNNLYSHTTIEPTIIEHNDSTLPIGSKTIENRTIGLNIIEDRTICSNVMEELSATDANNDYISNIIIVQLLPSEKRR
jgi:hypothetical protein